MLGLPKSTEVNRQLPKKLIYNKFQINTSAKDRFDEDISKLYIVNEISPSTTNVTSTEEMSSIYVLLIELKKHDFDEKNILLIQKLINQNMIFILQYEKKARLAVFLTKLMQTEFIKVDELKIVLNGLILSDIWNDIIVQISGVKIKQGNTLKEQLEFENEKKKLERSIEILEKQARRETQPRKKFEIVQKTQELKRILEELNNGQVKNA